MTELLFLFSFVMYLIYLYCEVQDITVRCGPVLIKRDKRTHGSHQLGQGREVIGRTKSPTPHLSSNPNLKAQKKPIDIKKNEENKPVVDIPPTSKIREVEELKKALVASLMDTL